MHTSKDNDQNILDELISSMEADPTTEQDEVFPEASPEEVASKRKPAKKRKLEKSEEEKKIKEFFQADKKRAKGVVYTGECHDCVEKFSFRNRPMICPYNCGYLVCIHCTQRYLLSGSKVPHCMNCRREWGHVFVSQNFTTKYLSQLNKHQQKLLVIQDKTLLPQAQAVLERRAKRKAQEYSLELQIQNLHNELQALRHEPDDEKDLTQSVVASVKCPLENCRGFMHRGLCGLCHKRICMKCMKEKPLHGIAKDPDVDEIKDDSDHGSDTENQNLNSNSTHVCNKEDLANAAYMRKHTKPCPCCGIRTSRTAGCDQMFCMNPGCNKGWNWATGKEDKGIIHNPHYFEWQQKNKGFVERNPLDVQCGGLPQNLPHVCDMKLHSTATYRGFLRTLHHVQQTKLPPVEYSTLNIRAEYLQGRATEERWGALLANQRRQFLIEQDFFNIHQTYVLAGTDIIQRLLESVAKSLEDLDESEQQSYLQEIEMLRNYYNAQLLQYSRYYKGKYRRFFDLIDSEWNTVMPTDASIVAELSTPCVSLTSSSSSSSSSLVTTLH